MLSQEWSERIDSKNSDFNCAFITFVHMQYAAVPIVYFLRHYAIFVKKFFFANRWKILVHGESWMLDKANAYTKVPFNFVIVLFTATNSIL